MSQPMVTLDHSIITLIRETLRPIARAAEIYDKTHVPRRAANWKPAGVLDLTIGDVRNCVTLLEQLDKLDEQPPEPAT